MNLIYAGFLLAAYFYLVPVNFDLKYRVLFTPLFILYVFYFRARKYLFIYLTSFYSRLKHFRVYCLTLNGRCSDEPLIGRTPFMLATRRHD